MMFELTDDDMVAVWTAIDAVRQLRQIENLDAGQIVGLGNALYALERLPEVTDGVACDFELVYSCGGESKYIEFEVSENAVCISTASFGYYPIPPRPGDPSTELSWRIGLVGFRERKNTHLLYELSDRICGFLHNDAEITVHDESRIEFESAALQARNTEASIPSQRISNGDGNYNPYSSYGSPKSFQR